ncbi:N-acetyltransferase [Mesorhizobium sp. B3-1-6]|uniref:GNAT family N-acetyltransferase n=1 Tax=Mesorhizobium sp. B3-1-6 TaxID=2589895 RepID=UPI0011262686|nr:GNAT family N-acetyltransferase [Mesorhizobium sp. B3-1-6]TPI35861.1 N-acetyltransferase [Mesorhizobium sp. B3-1-6]
MDGQVIDNPAQSRFEMALGDEIAVAYYKIEDGRVALLHTEVPQHLSGQGFGSKVAQGVFEAVRGSGRRAIAKCPFMS